MTFVARNQQYI